MKIIEDVKDKREFQVFIPDITLEEAQKNEIHVIRIFLPYKHKFLGMIQIDDPLVGISSIRGASQAAYTFLITPGDELCCRFYVTPVFPHIPFPWYDRDNYRYKHAVIFCEELGITVHSGMPLLHISVSTDPQYYDQFEAELKDIGYRIVDSKPYTRSEVLLNFYRGITAKQQSEEAKP